MPVARNDLRRDRLDLEPEPLAGDALHLGIAAAVRPDRARDLADAHSFERALEPHPVARQLERPARELRAERRRLGVHAVRPPDADRRAVLLGPADHRGERAVDARRG